VALGQAGGEFGLLAGLGSSDLAGVASLLMLPFAHEDLAIVLGAYAIVSGMLPAGLVAVCIYGGMVASDFALYGIGAGARRLPWLNRYAVDDRVERFGQNLKRNLFGLFALCRVVPGVVFVAFVACGWARVSLARFTVASLLISALYLPITLYLAVVFGDALDDHVGLWSWPVLLAVLVATAFVRRRVFAFGGPGEGSALASDERADHTHRRGMPLHVLRDRRVGRAERIPPLLFYAPLALSWIGYGLCYRSLTLPSAANPMIPTGGMWGESKSAYLWQVGALERRWVADFIVVQRSPGEAATSGDCDRALEALACAGIGFPLVAKPDIGWHGHGVCRVDDPTALAGYIRRFPGGAALILQRYIAYPGEAAVLYARGPGLSPGRIESLAFRHAPHVVGDGQSTVLELIRSDRRARWRMGLHLGGDRSHRGPSRRQLGRVPGLGEVVPLAFISNQRAGGLYRDARGFITAALTDRFDRIARSMPEFHYGRFDIRFESSEALMRGEGFSIVEINGIGGEAIDVWDQQLPVAETYRRLLAQQRLLFAIGDGNRHRGFRPMGAADFVAHLVRQTRLIRHLPPSA
jgi:membrane protein DedA with SNARE-associated domain